MILKILSLIATLSFFGCGVPGRPLPPLDKESIGHGFPKKEETQNIDSAPATDEEKEKKKDKNGTQDS